ncbi:MAG: DUF4260 domain-containing protein [Anaerolineales bacterium]
MKNLVRLEEFGLVLLAVFLFRSLNIAWWWFALLLLAPDLSMVGYLAGPRVGAFTYNLFHHKAVAVTAYVLGAWLGSPLLQFAGLIILAHSSLDRVLGYGLKYPDAFQHTHLGVMGKTPAVEPANS